MPGWRKQCVDGRMNQIYEMWVGVCARKKSERCRFFKISDDPTDGKSHLQIFSLPTGDWSKQTFCSLKGVSVVNEKKILDKMQCKWVLLNVLLPLRSLSGLYPHPRTPSKNFAACLLCPYAYGIVIGLFFWAEALCGTWSLSLLASWWMLILPI